MVFINVCLFQRTILHLFSHHSFTPSSCLHSLYHKTHSQVFFLSSFTPYLYFFRNTAAQPHHPLIFSSLALFLFVSQTTLLHFCDFFFFFVLLSFSVSAEGYMNGLWSSCIFDKTNRGWYFSSMKGLCCIIPALIYSCCASHWHQTVKVFHVLLLFQWRLAFTTHTIWWLLLSPLGAMCACSFITLGHGGNQTTNHASVTVTLYQLSLTESFLLAWDYSKIFCSTGPNANTDSSTALLVHEFMKSRALFPFCTPPSSVVPVFWCNRCPIAAQSKGMLNKMIGQEWGVFSRTFFTSQATVRSSDLCD